MEKVAIPIGDVIAAMVGTVRKKPTVERVIFNKPATIVFWSDGTKTVAKCNECAKWRMTDGTFYCSSRESCLFEPHVGLAVACAKKTVPDWRAEMNKWAGE